MEAMGCIVAYHFASLWDTLKRNENLITFSERQLNEHMNTGAGRLFARFFFYTSQSDTVKKKQRCSKRSRSQLK